jgi:hypothetical protein
MGGGDSMKNSNLKHALAGDCRDPDCEIHHPDVGIQEGTVTLTDLAFFVSGATMAADQIRNEVGETIDELIKENFIQYHEEAFNLVRSPRHHQARRRSALRTGGSMSHYVTLSIGDCRNIEAIKERLENTMDSDADEAEMQPWIDTLSSILAQAVKDGY